MVNLNWWILGVIACLFVAMATIPYCRQFAKRFYKAWKEAGEGAKANRGFSKGEMAILTDVYDQIREHMKASQKELEAINRDLEKKVLERTKQLEELSIRDPLTGLYNRRHFIARLKEEVSRSRRYNVPVSIIYIDIDHFKKFNDANGHPMGDALLEMFSTSLKRVLRNLDVSCRIGGEEFCIILPHTDLAGAARVAEKIRQVVEATDFPCRESQPLGTVTCSLGVSEFPGVAQNEEELVATADKALYAAKESGRNKVVMAHVPTTAAAA